MSNAKANILQRLRQHSITPLVENNRQPPGHNWSQQQKIARLTENMRAVRSEVCHLTNQSWSEWLNRELPSRDLNNVLIGSNNSCDNYIDKASQSLFVKQYQNAIDDWKHELFHNIDVGITSCKGAIAETGSLILWPDENEPRLLSLVPPVHIVLLRTDDIFETFSEAIEKLNWAKQTPTNALLVSGPSKTSDIEQTLAYGIHGPKQLIILIQ